MTNLDNVSTYHKDVALTFLLHTMPQDVRGRLMREHPAAYNALMGREIVRVINLSDKGDSQ